MSAPPVSRGALGALRSPKIASSNFRAHSQCRSASSASSQGRHPLNSSRNAVRRSAPPPVPASPQNRRQPPKPLPYQSTRSAPTSKAAQSSSKPEAQTQSSSSISSPTSPTTSSPELFHEPRQEEMRSMGGYLPLSKPVEELRHYRTGLSFKQMSRRITALMTALPFAVVSGWVLWQRWRDGTLNLEEELGSWGGRIMGTEGSWGRRERKKEEGSGQMEEDRSEAIGESVPSG